MDWREQNQFQMTIIKEGYIFSWWTLVRVHIMVQKREKQKETNEER